MKYNCNKMKTLSNISYRRQTPGEKFCKYRQYLLEAITHLSPFRKVNISVLRNLAKNVNSLANLLQGTSLLTQPMCAS